MLKIRLATEVELEDVARIYMRMYPEHEWMQMYQWVKSGKPPSRQHFVLLSENKEIVGAITWELYDNYKQKVVAKIKWLFLKKEFRGGGLGKKLILESFRSFNNSWQGKVVTIRVAPYEGKSGLERWYKKILDQLPGPEAKITLIPNLFGEGNGEYVVVKNLK